MEIFSCLTCNHAKNKTKLENKHKCILHYWLSAFIKIKISEYKSILSRSIYKQSKMRTVLKLWIKNFITNIRAMFVQNNKHYKDMKLIQDD